MVPRSYEGDPTVVGQVKEEEEGREKEKRKEQTHAFNQMHKLRFGNTPTSM